MAEKPVPALLLAAGLGTRLAPLTDSIPKCLVPIHGKPLLSYWLDLLGREGLEPLIVNTHHHAERVREFVAANPWRDKIVLAHEEELLGTGGTLLIQRERLAEGPFFVAHADNLSRFKVADFLAAHRQRPDDCVMTMMLFHSPTPETCGIVERDTLGRVIHFHEKVRRPPGNLANAAVYVMEPEIFDTLRKTEKAKPDISLHVVPPCLGRINTWINDDYHRDVGTPESYRMALKEYME